jgi:pyrroloquinoline quinone biosynthesis protein B
VSADGERWVLVNASPDLRAQIEAEPALHPGGARRSSPIAAVVLTNGDVDAVAGLLTLREGTPFALHAHERVLAVLGANPIFEVVRRDLVPRRPLPLDRWIALEDAAGTPLGLELRAFAVPGKVPLYLEGGASEAAILDADAGEAVGLEIRAGGRRLVYLANTAAIPERLRERLRGADLAFVDGTLWRDDEMIALGAGTKTGRRMAHVSMSGPDGAMARLEGLGIGRAVFIHVNNTNPALLADSPERAELERRGFEVARDGMAIELDAVPARA